MWFLSLERTSQMQHSIQTSTVKRYTQHCCFSRAAFESPGTQQKDIASQPILSFKMFQARSQTPSPSPSPSRLQVHICPARSLQTTVTCKRLAMTPLFRTRLPGFALMTLTLICPIDVQKTGSATTRAMVVGDKPNLSETSCSRIDDRDTPWL